MAEPRGASLSLWAVPGLKALKQPQDFCDYGPLSATKRTCGGATPPPGT